MKRFMLVVIVAMSLTATFGLTSCATFNALLKDPTSTAYAAPARQSSFGRQLFETVLAGVFLQYQNQNWVLHFNGQIAASNLAYYGGGYPYVSGNYYGQYDFMVPPAFQGFRLRPVYVYTPNDFDKGVNFYDRGGQLLWRVVVGPGPYAGKIVLLPVGDGEFFTFNWDKGGGRIPLRISNSRFERAPIGVTVASVIKAETYGQAVWQPYNAAYR